MSNNSGMYLVGSGYFLMYESGIFTGYFGAFFSLYHVPHHPFLSDVHIAVLKYE